MSKEGTKVLSFVAKEPNLIATINTPGVVGTDPVHNEAKLAAIAMAEELERDSVFGIGEIYHQPFQILAKVPISDSYCHALDRL